MKRYLGFLMLLLLSLAVAAQNSPQQGRTKLGGTPSEQRIIKEVHHELVMLPYYSVFDNLAYKVQGNTVTLLGQVSRPSLKSDAEGVVKKIEGVDSVQNEIEVLPPSPADDQIRRAVYRAIYGDAQLSKYAWGAVPPIHIIVKGGRVTLEGVVDNETDKNVANIRARGVPGVFEVTNNLQVVKS
jgi:hyperosmotically inducible protein